MFVNVERGRAEGIALAKELENLDKEQEDREEVLTDVLFDGLDREHGLRH